MTHVHEPTGIQDSGLSFQGARSRRLKWRLKVCERFSALVLKSVERLALGRRRLRWRCAGMKLE